MGLSLSTLLPCVAYMEAGYFAAAMMPPSMVKPLLGWNLTADGHWMVKLMGMAVLTQAHTAWVHRKNPNVEVAKGLAFYQMASATVDWVMWITMKDEGIFDNPVSQALTVTAIITHYTLGLALMQAIRTESRKKDE